MQTMATQMRFLSGPLRLVSVRYNGGLKVLSSLLQRGYAAQDNGANKNETVVVFEAQRDPERPESEIFVKTYDDQFGEQFRHLPLPGNVTTADHFVSFMRKICVTPPKVTSVLDQSDIMSAQVAHHRQLTTLQIFSEASKKIPPVDIESSQSSLSSLECVVQPCPELLRKHFVNLFPGRDLQKGTLTVITVTQRTENDMGTWSEEVDNEREELIAQFISTASAICDNITRDGHWADFVNPTSGKPYLGPFSEDTLFETDERYGHFGFTIEDLGCCKVIKHKLWGTHAFVGSIFCDAPLASLVLQKFLPEHCTFVESISVSHSISEELRSQQSVAAGPVDRIVSPEPPRVTRNVDREKDLEVRVRKHEE